MSTISWVLSVLLVIDAILLVIVVLLQNGREAGLGAIGGAGSADSYWSRNKANSMEGALSRYTKILGALLLILALIINFTR